MSRKYNEELAALDNSEVFHEFLKVIAYDSGLSNYDEDKINVGGLESKETAKDISDLYSNKATEDQDENGSDLIEAAHDKEDSFEVVDTYLDDAGEYKDAKKTHKITLDVAQKEPRLYNTFHKNISAIQDLMNELIVIADEMDIRKHDDIVSFADEILDGINNTGEAVKEKITKQARTGYGKPTSWPKAILYIALIVAGGALLYSNLGRFGSMKTYSIKVACESFTNGVKRYISKNQSELDAESIAILNKITSIVNKFQNDYYNMHSIYKTIYNKIITLTSDEGNDVNQIEKTYEDLVAINTKMDHLSASMNQPLQNAMSNLTMIKEEVESTSKVEGERTKFDPVWENLTSLYQSAYGTEADFVLIENFKKLIASIDSNKAARSKKLNSLKVMVDNYKETKHSSEIYENTSRMTTKESDENSPFIGE
jgi:hypothetical protein